MIKYIFSLFLCTLSFSLFSQSITLTEIGGPYPWLLGFEMPSNDNRFYTIRQNGFIVIVDKNAPTTELTFLDISTKINLEGEQGLLGLAFHPDYENNGYFYVYYCAATTKKSTISRFSRSVDNPDFTDSNSEEILLTFDQPTIKHNAGCLQFGPDGYLYISSGDGGELNDPQNNGQKTNTYLGKMLRIDVDNGNPYSIPSDNPFDQMFGYHPEIWATGLRNPWRFSFDRMTGDLWISDVGQEEWEEIIFQPANDAGGQNYGWSCREGTSDFNSFGCVDPDGFTNPTYQYAHTDTPDCSGSITGGFVYRGMEHSNLFGKYIYSDFCTGTFTALTKNGDEISAESLGDFNPFDYISFSENEVGELFVMSYFSGRIFQINTDECAPVAHILTPNQTIGCVGDTLFLNAYSTENTSISYKWERNGILIPGATSPQLIILETGDYQLITQNLTNNCSTVSESIYVEFFDSSTTTLYEEICEGESFTFNGNELTEADIYQFDYLSQNGCDSLVFLNLNVLSNISETLNLDIEANTFFDDILIENDTTIFQHLTATNGCDSLVTIHFSILTTSTNFLNKTTDISVFPNPVSDGFYLKNATPTFSKADFKIYNAFGEHVTHEFSFYKNQTYFKRENAPAGVYFLIIKNRNITTNLKFVCF
jgi:hypothetical protein